MPSKRTTPEAPKRPRGKKPFGRATLARGPAGGELSHKNAALPHERDELAQERGGPPDKDIEQALKDVEAGQVDTDLRGTATRQFKRKTATPRKSGPS
jgi:hypothetical protein